VNLHCFLSSELDWGVLGKFILSRRGGVFAKMIPQPPNPGYAPADIITIYILIGRDNQALQTYICDGGQSYSNW